MYHVRICNNQMFQSGASQYDKDNILFSSDLGSRNALTLLPQTVLDAPLAKAISRLINLLKSSTNKRLFVNIIQETSFVIREV